MAAPEKIAWRPSAAPTVVQPLAAGAVDVDVAAIVAGASTAGEGSVAVAERAAVAATVVSVAVAIPAVVAF